MNVSRTVALIGALLIMMTGCGQTAQSPEDPAANQPSVSVPAEPGDVAVWELLGGASADSTSIEIGVTRLGCASGITGETLQPGFTYELDRIIITVNVEALPDGAYTCPSNDIVTVSLDLSQPIGDRTLVDGACLEAEATQTSFCENPDGIRWPQP